MHKWLPMFALPNIDISEPIETEGLALVPVRDERIQKLAKDHPNFAAYLNSFRTEFDDPVYSSVILWRDDTNESYRSVEAISGFRDAVAMATIPYAWAHVLRYENNFNIRYSNSFAFYPWMIDARYEGVIMQSMAQLGYHEVKALKPQTSPGIARMQLTARMVDEPLLNAILARWKPRFESDTPEWGDTALYRALNMAFSAASLPGNVEVTIHDIGKAISLWVSAFEILAHTGDSSGYVQVYGLLEKIGWNLTACNEPIYEALGIKPSQGKRSLPIWLYGELHRARNDFLHGNRIDAMRLIVAPAKRPLHTYAPLLFRMALAAFLDLKMDRRPPPREGETDYEAYLAYRHQFGHYQSDIEAALSTIMFTVEEYRTRSGRK
jgi:hypothetical protein